MTDMPAVPTTSNQTPSAIPGFSGTYYKISNGAMPGSNIYFALNAAGTRLLEVTRGGDDTAAARASISGSGSWQPVRGFSNFIQGITTKLSDASEGVPDVLVYRGLATQIRYDNGNNFGSVALVGDIVYRINGGDLGAYGNLSSISPTSAEVFAPDLASTASRSYFASTNGVGIIRGRYTDVGTGCVDACVILSATAAEIYVRAGDRGGNCFGALAP